MTIRVLIVEDESLIRWTLRKTFEERGYQVTEAENGESATSALETGTFDLVMLDYKLPDTTGLDILRRLHQDEFDGVVIMMTAYGTIEHAVEAIKLGAFDYVPKPFEVEELLFVVDKGLETTRLRREVRALRQQIQDEYGADGIIGKHATMQRVMGMIQRIARSGASTVMLRGETGTGKDLAARAIHRTSDRCDQPFVNITCTALPDALLESELFGHERGAFTDAKTQKTGLLELAHGGTVFLDEVGDMPANLQAKLLRFLEERAFRRVGGTREITVDVRVIAATNRPIEKAIEQGDFRADLYYRLNVVTIELPPLRERGDDVGLLTQHFVDRYAREFKKTVHGLDEAAAEKMSQYEWPGNVRELRNVIERAVLLCDGECIRAEEIAFGRAQTSSWPWSIENFKLPDEGFDLSKLHSLEAQVVTQALKKTGNNQVQAAKLLNVSRDRLRYRAQKYGLL